MNYKKNNEIRTRICKAQKEFQHSTSEQKMKKGWENLISWIELKVSKLEHQHLQERWGNEKYWFRQETTKCKVTKQRRLKQQG